MKKILSLLALLIVAVACYPTTQPAAPAPVSEPAAPPAPEPAPAPEPVEPAAPVSAPEPVTPEPAEPAVPEPAASAEEHKVDMKEFKFSPNTLTVKAGDSVTFTNADGAPHTATMTSGPEKFDTGKLVKGQSKTVTLSKPGTYTYICEFHPGMKGTIVVE
ncbi:cupredoxin domain-containing protein [Candidatus Woesearchaeota archaeon]|nr:cupredoxin domain-containing protein [Candidatus Woesearchaeota archaeon]